MFDLDNWQEVWATLRSNRLRTFLTAFGVFWGILMLMAMLGVRLEHPGGQPAPDEGHGDQPPVHVGPDHDESRTTACRTGRQVKFDISDIELLRRLPGIEWLAPRLQLGGWMSGYNVSYEGKTGSFTVMGDYPDFRHIFTFEYQAGRFINERDIAETRKVAVIGRAIRDELFPPDVEPDRQVPQDQRRVLRGRRGSPRRCARAARAIATRTPCSCRSRR